MFGGLIGSGFVPILHLLLSVGVDGLKHFPMTHLAMMILCYAFGVAVYAGHVPEKFWPEYFDVWVS